jgi:pimeloyl-ACP methyl ester carboxylesterase
VIGDYPDPVPDWIVHEPPPSRAREPDETDHVDAGSGVRVYYEVFGDSPDVVCFVPPWAINNLRTWHAQVPYLSRHFRVIVIDPRGNGRSDRPPDLADYSREAHVGDVLAVLDAAGAERAMLVSASPRAPVALELAVRYPERVRAAAFITPQLWVERSFVTQFTAGRHDRYDGMEKLNPHYWKRDYRGFVEWFARWVSPHPHSTRQIEEIVHQAMQTDGETLIRATVGFQMYERDEALRLAREVRCPVLVTQNGGAALYPKHTSGVLAEATGGRLHVFEGLGPLVGSRWPVRMNLVLREFFEEVRATDRAEREVAA